jgi:hypothetical protein
MFVPRICVQVPGKYRRTISHSFQRSLSYVFGAPDEQDDAEVGADGKLKFGAKRSRVRHT